MISEIENAIVARIQAAQDAGALGYQLKHIETYGGALSDEMRQVIKSLPAIWVIFAGATKTTSRSGGSRTIWSAKFSVIMAAKSLRNEKSSRHGSGGEIGSYQMIKDVTSLISNEKLGLDITPLEPLRVISLFNNKSDRDLASIYSIEFQTTYEFDHSNPANSIDDFATFNVNWDVPVLGNVSTTLPADATADATDTIALETN